MLCTMREPKVFDDLLSEQEIEALWDYILEGELTEVKLDGSAKMYVMELPEGIKERLLLHVVGATEQKLKPLSMFIRYNSPKSDVSFRIHSDGELNGEQPTVASVYYLNSGNNGTALFKHALYGTHPVGDTPTIHAENNPGWEITTYCEQKANRLFVYDARHFHGRFPFESLDDRFVVVGFYKEV